MNRLIGVKKRRSYRRRKAKRDAYTLLELMISSSVGAILVGGLSGSLYIASQSFDQSNSDANLSTAHEILGNMMLDLNQAIRFTERTPQAVTFTVPDRTGDGTAETIRYAWNGAAGDPLTYEFNGSSVVKLASGVQRFDLSYLTRMVTADVTPVSPVVAYEGFSEKKEGVDTTSLAINLPTGTSAGDLLIVCAAIDDDVMSSIVPPAGWNVASAGAEQSTLTFGVLWKIATASEPSAIQFTWSGNQKAYGWIMRFTGHDPNSPIDTLATAVGTSSSPTSPAVTTTAGGAMILRVGGFNNKSVTQGDTGLVSHTTITMDKSGSGGGSTSGGAGYATQATPGDSGTANFSLTGSEAYRTVTIAIAPNP